MKNKEKEFKNSVWNRLSHGKEVRANAAKKQELQKLIDLAPKFVEKIGTVTYIDGDTESAKVTGVTSLLDVLALHKEAWAAGFQTKGICPCSSGFFRTEAIETMKPEEVFLGDIYQMWTFNIPEWEKHKHDGKSGGALPIFDYLTDYQIILRQYKGQLNYNINLIKEKAEKELNELVAMGY